MFLLCVFVFHFQATVVGRFSPSKGAQPVEPDLPEPDLPEPDLPEPDLPESDLPEPDLPEPDLSEPDLPESVSTPQRH